MKQLLNIIIMLSFLGFGKSNAETKKEFRFAGNTAKFIMLMGICYLFIFAYTLLHFSHAIKQI